MSSLKIRVREAEFNYSERLLLLQAMIVRRVPSHRQSQRIQPQLLMESLQADLELVREQTPELYFQDFINNLSDEVDICVDEGLIEDGWARRMGRLIRLAEYRRTKTGQQLLDTMEPRLAEALDSMPMSDVGILDFLSLI